MFLPLLVSSVYNYYVHGGYANPSKWCIAAVAILSPATFLIPYRIAKPNDKFIFVALGLVIPTIFLSLSFLYFQNQLQY